MKIAIGGDHAGFVYKQPIIDFLSAKGNELKDFGTYSSESCDYPDFAHAVANAVETNECEYGILLCGSANGVAITANKHQQVRAGLAWNEEVAELIRAHNNANVLCIPTRFTSLEQALAIASKFFSTTFEGGRHENRVKKIAC